MHTTTTNRLFCLFIESMCSKRKTMAVLLWLLSLWLISLYATQNETPKSSQEGAVDKKTPVKEANLKNVYLCPPRIAVTGDVRKLGNNFFQYLAARLMAEVMNSELFITSSFAKVYDKYFIGRRIPVVDWNVLQYHCRVPQSAFVPLRLDYLPDLQPPLKETPHVIISGYPVDITTAVWEAIFNQRNRFIDEFEWRPEIKDSIVREMAEIKATHNTGTTVAIHVRKTDYFAYLVALNDQYRTTNSTYFDGAMNYFRQKYTRPVFLVFSSDMEWCKENIKGSDVIYTGNGNDFEPGYDLALMSSCDHIILTYGTYGIVAAWFNGHGEVITADNFTDRPEKVVERLKKIKSLNWQWNLV